MPKLFKLEPGHAVPVSRIQSIRRVDPTPGNGYTTCIVWMTSEVPYDEQCTPEMYRLQEDFDSVCARYEAIDAVSALSTDQTMLDHHGSVWNYMDAAD